MNISKFLSMDRFSRLPNMSSSMSFFYKLGFVRISWSLRRLYCPVDKNMKVLEIGSGGNPYYRANVLLDSFIHSQERHWEPLVIDRPTVLGYGENLPFKDNSFDFIIASHVLEHSAYPEKFINELQRVGKAGYIETPDAFMERINPYHDHRAEVYIDNKSLVINKKNRWCVDDNLLKLYNNKARNIIANDVIPSNPFIFHARLYWKNKIKFKILNPTINSDWPSIDLHEISISNQTDFIKKAKKFILLITRVLFTQKKINSKIEIEKLLICTSCKSDKLLFAYRKIKCSACNSFYSYEQGLPNMTKPKHKIFKMDAE